MRFTASCLALALCAGSAAAQAQMPDNKEVLKKRANEPVLGRTMSEWTSDLKDKDPSVREMAVAALKSYGEAARSSVPALIKAISDSDVSLRVNAVISLGFIGLDDKDVDTGVNALMRCLRDRQGIVRFQAAKAIGNLGQNTNAAVPLLTELLRDTMTWEIREAAAFALGTAGWNKQKGADQNAINALIGGGYERSGLHDSCQEVRLQAIFSLILLGAPASPTTKKLELQVLRALTTEKQPEKIIIWAHVAIMRIENKVTEEHMLVIAKYLKHKSAAVRVHACRGLATIGRDGKSRVPDLIDALDDIDSSVVSWACITLGMIGNPASAAVPKLEKLKNHADPSVRDNARKAIDAISEKIREKN
jgi:HEAT repeat protein